MTFKIERSSAGGGWVVRLIGFVRSEHLEEISRELRLCGPGAALDLEAVTVLGVEVVRFLSERERQGTRLLQCPAFVREWIRREAAKGP
jgi:hypothetical protein